MGLEAAIISGVVAFAVAVLVQFIAVSQTNKTLRHQTEQAERDRRFNAEEARRIEWKNYLIGLMHKLIEAREEYERFLGTAKDDKERHAAIVGKAIAVSSAIKDEVLQRYATDELTPYFADKKNPDGTIQDWPSRNRNAMQTVVQRLADIIRES